MWAELPQVVNNSLEFNSLLLFFGYGATGPERPAVVGGVTAHFIAQVYEPYYLYFITCTS